MPAAWQGATSTEPQAGPAVQRPNEQLIPSGQASFRPQTTVQFDCSGR
jgi:hypothetical protein